MKLIEVAAWVALGILTMQQAARARSNSLWRARTSCPANPGPQRNCAKIGVNQCWQAGGPSLPTATPFSPSPKAARCGSFWVSTSGPREERLRMP